MKPTTTLIAAFFTVFTPVLSSAQDDAQVKEPEGRIKRAITALFTDKDPSEGGRGIHLGPITPRVNIMSSGSGVSPIVHFWTPNIFGTPLDIHASAAYSMFRYQYYDLQVGLVPHDLDRLPRVETSTNALFPIADLEKTSAVPGFNVYASARYRDYPREDYYGEGARAPRADHTDFRQQDALYEGIIRFRVRRLSIMARAGLLEASILPGLDSTWPNTAVAGNEANAPGLLASPDFIHASVGAWLELRDEPGNSHRGVALGAAFSRYDARGGAAFDFNRIMMDAREFIPLGSNRHVLALRQTVALDDPSSGNRVPFYLRTTLGGSSFLRGYGSFRYRDDRLMVMAGEYRFELRPRVELALLYEAGKVFPVSQSLSFGNLRRDYGLGIRLKSPRKVRVRFDVLRGDEGFKAHIKLGSSF
jgi:hypothetical protein